MGQNDDLRLLLTLLTGFVVFSLPLLAHDTRHLWGGAERTPHPGHEEGPPSPPYPSYYHHDDNDPGFKFRHAISEGNLDDAEKLYAEAMAADPPVNLATQQHWHGSTALFEAARSGHLHAAKWLLSRGADADASNEWGDSAANEAASMGHWDVVWYLADQGANLTRTSDNAHASLVLSAVRHKATDALAQMQKRGVDLSVRHWNGNTILHEAARMGEEFVLIWLLEHAGIDVDTMNDSGETALAEAATMGHLAALWKLVHKGASLGEPGSHRATSLFHSAIRHGAVDVLNLMLERGALNATGAGQPDEHGRHPLVEAVRTGQTPTIDWLLEQKVDPNGKSENGDSAIAAAAFEGKFELVWRLEAAGADTKVTNEYGGTLLMSAVHHGQEEAVRTLLTKGLDVNQHNHRGDTPLTLAASKGDMGLLQLLLEKGATAEPKGKRQDTPLIRAAKFRRIEAVRLLLSKGLSGLDVNARNRNGDTALIEACRSGNMELRDSAPMVEVATTLLDAGADVALADNAGVSALLAAAESGSVELVKLLAERGADMHAKTKHDENGIDLSKWTSNAEELKTLFQSHGVVARDPEEDHDVGGYHGHAHGEPSYHGGHADD